jgi:hypothetical protein
VRAAKAGEVAVDGAQVGPQRAVEVRQVQGGRRRCCRCRYRRRRARSPCHTTPAELLFLLS